MDLEFEKEFSDARGKMRFYSYGKTKINLIETRKGFVHGVVTVQ